MFIPAPPVYARETASGGNASRAVERAFDYKGFYEGVAADNAAGLPLYVSACLAATGARAFDEDYFMAKSFTDDDETVMELSIKASPNILEPDIIGSSPPETLEICFRRPSKKTPKKSGVAFYIPCAVKLYDKKPLKLYFALNRLENPYLDQGRFYAFITTSGPKGFRSGLETLLRVFEEKGIKVEIAVKPSGANFVKCPGRPAEYIAGYGASELNAGPAFYPSTFFMPRKSGSSTDSASAAHLIAEAVSRGYLSSARERLYSAAGAPVQKWNSEVGNDGRVFLSYGPGITYADPESAMFILSPEVLFLRDVEFTERDTFYFKPAVMGRDPLSEAWTSSFNENTTLFNRKIKSYIDGFNSANKLDTPAGRSGYFKKIDAFWLEEGLFYTSQLASALYEKFNNEVKVAGVVSLDVFGECVVAGPQICEKLVEEIKTRHQKEYFAGLPVQDFVFGAYPISDYRPDGVKTDMPLRYAYLEYILREARRPEFLALAAARESRDLYAYLRIIKGASADLKNIISSPGYFYSRRLRRTLKKLVPGSAAYAGYLDEYRWWKKPGNEAVKKASEIGPLDEAALERIAAAAAGALAKTGADIPEGLKIRYAKPMDFARYVIFSECECVIDRTFLSMIYYKCGIDGVYHLISHELAARYCAQSEVFEKSEAALAMIGKRPVYEELFDAMNFSNERRRAVNARIESRSRGASTSR